MSWKEIFKRASCLPLCVGGGLYLNKCRLSTEQSPCAPGSGGPFLWEATSLHRHARGHPLLLIGFLGTLTTAHVIGCSDAAQPYSKETWNFQSISLRKGESSPSVSVALCPGRGCAPSAPLRRQREVPGSLSPGPRAIHVTMWELLSCCFELGRSHHLWPCRVTVPSLR